MFNSHKKMRLKLYCFILLLTVSMHSLAGAREAGQKKIASTLRSQIQNIQTVSLEVAATGQIVNLPTLSLPMHSAKLFSRSSGFITAIFADIGDKVGKGELLAIIDNPQIMAQEKKILADINAAKAELELNQLNFQRAEQLIADNLISGSDRDRLRLQVAKTQASITGLEAQLEENLSHQTLLEIRAPFAGYIVAKGLEVGDLASADSSQNDRYFFEIANTQRLRLSIRVPKNELGNIVVGNEVFANFIGYQSVTAKGRIMRLSQFIDEKSGTMLVEAEIDNRDYKLPAGLRGTVAINTNSDAKTNPVWSAPLSAISYHEGHDAVIGISNGEIKFHKVEIISKSSNRVTLRGSLDHVDKVVLNPNAFLME
ncbi:efflux RND transporter periplasmic adaptor subunit [Aliiglaciecola sp. LCG003]|uniref:efflux RND transporter periplasmic adaptor subunit n=1 Tax=Aliiglaciecola sp. LCG003 TaxID=3053655 RepID=UPI00257284F7|nr:efflux RND transporter periplasmic adaptor subunit [Aliiglaciecola sp. LCG003]WJG10762.1 efflux RND transporter periplasmic adaptor subunit [Aliiglaciecola sp. LCG003]